MAATIKPIDGRCVHQIQSGQVIVDLCSVVKELVENSIDAGATSIDVRFKNQGLDLVEVQDNGSGISPANHASVALKHHTSKLSSYSDIASLQTFGFRGEALASLCALSTLTVTTCLQDEVPKGSRLCFESSGQLKGTAVVAAERGTTVSVDRLFHNLPVRRRELERNIKREWHKVIALLNQYACVQTNLRFCVSQQPTKGKRMLLFSTKGNPTTRDNIINVFGAKAMSALLALDLGLELQPSGAGPGVDTASNTVRVVGHISRPSPGDGRQTPDRQMLFVNGRPCALPQFAKAFNEVYRSYNYSQSPFIFADVRLDTHLYDVNVSPDKRSILLHDQSRLLDTLRTSLKTLFDAHDYTVPLSQPSTHKQGPARDRIASCRSTAPSVGRTWGPRGAATDGLQTEGGEVASDDSDSSSGEPPARQSSQGPADQPRSESGHDQDPGSPWPNAGQGAASESASPDHEQQPISACEVISDASSAEPALAEPEAKLSEPVCVASKGDRSELARPVRDFNQRLAESGTITTVTTEPAPGVAASETDVASDGDGPGVPAVEPLRLDNRGGENSLPSPRSVKHPRQTTTAVAVAVAVAVGDQAATGDGHAPGEGVCVPGKPRARLGGGGLSSGMPSSTFAIGQGDGEDAQSAIPSRAEAVRVQPPRDTQTSEADGHDGLDSPQSRWRGAGAHPRVEERESQGAAEELTDSGRGHASTRTAPPEQTLGPGTRRGNAPRRATRRLRIDEDTVRLHMEHLASHGPAAVSSTASAVEQVEDISASDAESKLPLIIARSDFAKMRLVGQFNMGFVIAVRPAAREGAASKGAEHDELFIVDQHASDEKYNFERLQGTTTVQSQRLVHPRRLQLTALEEEVVMENLGAIEANGFKIAVDAAGDWPVGSRCQVVALPLSRETTFSLEDLQELISLLGDESSESRHIPRPSKVRKMFSMRACRSSIMIGRALTGGQMYTLLRQMGELDKPWNCPHGRPTMRHLCRLQAWDGKCWGGDTAAHPSCDWQAYGRGWL